MSNSRTGTGLAFVNQQLWKPSPGGGLEVPGNAGILRVLLPGTTGTANRSALIAVGRLCGCLALLNLMGGGIRSTSARDLAPWSIYSSVEGTSMSRRMCFACF